MPREKSKAEIDNENRARAGANALNRLGLPVKYTPSIYAKPVYDLIVDAKRAVQLSEKYRTAIVNRAKGMTDVYDVMPDVEPIGSITCLSEVVRMVSDICLTDSAAFIEGLDVAFVVNSLEPFRAKQDAF